MKRERLVALDFLRWVCFLPVISFHFIEAVWDPHKELYQPVMSTDAFFWNGIHLVLRALSFSGFSILFITIFLMGLTSPRRRINWPVITLLPFGWIIFCLLYQHFRHIYFFWDIYPLIALVLLLVQLLFRYTKVRETTAMVIGLMVTSIPFWKFSWGWLPLPLQMILVGSCETSLSAWPVLPWGGLILFAYAYGRKFHDRTWVNGCFRGVSIGRKEAVFWAAALAVSPFFWGAYFRVNLYSLYVFDCMTFRQDPHIFWAHMVWIVFFARVGLVPQVQRFFVKNVAMVSRFATSQNFGLIYFYSFLLAYAVAALGGARLRQQPELFTLVITVFWPLVDVTGTGGIFLLRKLKVRMKASLSSQAGVSFIEVLIASSIGLTMMLAFVSLMASQQKVSREVAHTFEIASLRARIAETLSEGAACLQNFNNINPNTGFSLSSLRDRTGTILYQVGGSYGGGLISIKSIQVNKANPAVGANDRGSFDLTLEFQKHGGYLMSQDVPVNIPIFVKTAATGRVERCSSQGTPSDLQCVYPNRTCYGCHNLQVPCPPGRYLTGGGIEDGDTSKKSFTNRPLFPGTPGFPTGGWQCANNDGGTMICTAVCCK